MMYSHPGRNITGRLRGSRMRRISRGRARSGHLPFKKMVRRVI